MERMLNDAGEVWWTDKRAAAQLGLCVNMIWRIRHDLKKKGLLTWTQDAKNNTLTISMVHIKRDVAEHFKRVTESPLPWWMDKFAPCLEGGNSYEGVNESVQ